MFANITLQPVTEQAVLTIPRSSVIRSGGMSRVVLAEGNGKYRSARIDIGREAGDRLEVLAGLTEQDRVVTSAHFMLDSESSLTADLSRINGTDTNIEVEADTAWAKGEIMAVMADHNMLTINHQPVAQWDWPGMTMNFSLAKGIDLSGLTVGQAIEFEMQKTDAGQYEVININTDTPALVNEVWIKGEITMLMADFGMITLSHQPVDQWSWDAGEMNFSVDDSVELSNFSEGQNVEFLVSKQGDNFTLKSIKNAGESQ
jgi:Cu(I)/Ag(I) efflux system membrane fusion protein